VLSGQDVYYLADQQEPSLQIRDLAVEVDSAVPLFSSAGYATWDALLLNLNKPHKGVLTLTAGIMMILGSVSAIAGLLSSRFGPEHFDGGWLGYFLEQALSRMFGGVSKSGSPTTRFTIDLPSRRISLARSAAAVLGEGLMRLTRWAIRDWFTVELT